MGVHSTFTKIMRGLTKTKGKISGPDSQLAEMPSALSGWACLPTDLLNLVLDRITDFSDFIRFSSICQLWRFVALQPPQFVSHSQSNRLRHQHQQNLHLLKTCRNQLPMILTKYPPPTNKHNNRQGEDQWSLYSVTEGAFYNIQLSIPSSQRLNCASRGWLLTIDDYSMVITLINPFLDKRFSLPPCDVIPALEALYRGKAILLFDTGQVNFNVFMKLAGKLAYFTSKTLTWVRIKTPLVFKGSDIISYKGCFYAVSSTGNLMHVDVSGSSCKTVASVADGNIRAHVNRLVESQEGDLLFVRCFINNIGSRAETFTLIEVYKLLSPKTQRRGVNNSVIKWDRINKIGEQALFLADNCESISISTRDFPAYKPNCIYFVDRYYDISEEMPQKGEKCVGWPYPFPPAIWIVPYFKA